MLTKELDVVSKEQLKCLRSTESSPGNQTDTEGMRGTRGNRNHGWSIQNKQCPTLRGLWKEFLEEIRANGKQDKCGACLPKVGCANDLRTDVPAGGKAADLIPAASHNVFPTPPAWEVVPGGRDHDLRARFVKMAKPWAGRIKPGASSEPPWWRGSSKPPMGDGGGVLEVMPSTLEQT